VKNINRIQELVDSLNEDTIVWLQRPEHTSDENQYWAEEEKRLYIDLKSSLNPLNAIFSVVIRYMDRELGGYPDLHDPLPFRIVSKQGVDAKSSHVLNGMTYVNGIAKSGETKGFGLSFNCAGGTIYGYTYFGNNNEGIELKLPIRASKAFNWTVLTPEDFERLMYRLYCQMDGVFENIQWLQKLNAPDGGRDISAIRITNENRVLIQAKHQKASLNDTDVGNILLKAEKWNPPFQEVIIVTTSAFTRDAIQWAEAHNENKYGRPIIRLEPSGHLEVMLAKHPSLLSHSGLR